MRVGPRATAHGPIRGCYASSHPVLRKRRNYTVLGRTVNIGARLCSKAPAGHILISGATKDRAGDDVIVTGPESMLLKGITSPFVVFDVQRISARA